MVYLSCTLCRRYMFNVLCIIVVIMLTCVVRVNMVYLLPLQAYRPHTSTHKANCCFVYVATPVRHTNKKKLSAVVVPWISIQHITHIIMMQPHRQTHTHTILIVRLRNFRCERTSKIEDICWARSCRCCRNLPSIYRRESICVFCCCWFIFSQHDVGNTECWSRSPKQIRSKSKAFAATHTNERPDTNFTGPHGGLC